MYQDTARTIVIKKASRMGISELAISYSLHACDERACNVFYAFPTDEGVGEFSRMKFGVALEASTYLSNLVVSSYKDQFGGRVSGADKVSLKRIRKNWLILRGTKVQKDGRAPQMKGFDADCVVFDEYDEMDPRAPTIGRERYGASKIKEERSLSTPSHPGVGIDVEYDASDQREWFLVCPHCGHWQMPTIDRVVIEWDDLERPVAWYGMDEGRAYLACERCELELDRLARGQWVAKHPGRPVHGYHPTQLMSAYVAPLEIVQALQTADENKRKEAFNQKLGLAYTPRGGKLTEQHLDACRDDYGMGSIVGAYCSMGVDVGKLFHVVIRTHLDDQRKRRLLFAGEVSDVNDLLMLEKQYKPKTIVIDGLPETRTARAFQKSLPDGRVWLAFYEEGEKWTQPIEWKWKDGNVNLARTWSLDVLLAGFFEKQNLLPANIRNVAGYYKHLTALIRTIVKDSDGNAVARYISAGDDHYAMAENYCQAADMRALPWTR
jgi:hypothetical protein